MKKIYLLAAAAALFAACSSDKVSLDTPQQTAQLEEGAVGFSAYMQRATTRGGWAGSLTTNTPGTVKLTEVGFGVFGYYTDNNEYDQRSTPNFFYNQLVYWDGTSSWKYEPLKYWPNEYGQNAISEDADKVTYFAYAPWIDVVPSSGKVVGADDDKTLEQYGITGMTRNSNQGDPILKYIASFNSYQSIDLCWGVADNDDGQWPTTTTVKEGAAQSIANGLPWLDVERPANIGQKVKFTFKHALAQMRVNIDADVDVDGHNSELIQVDKKTRVWVREVTFKGFTMKGSLNLNNEDKYEPKWLDYNGQNELVAEAVTIYDGRKDGKEGVNGAVATNEKTLGLNPTLIQDGIYTPATGTDVYADVDLYVYGVNTSGATQTNDANYDRKGVTRTRVNLFDQYPHNPSSDIVKTNKSWNTEATDYPIHVIPTDEPFEVEIVYDVETVSENLAQNLSDGQTKGTSVENRISQKVLFGAADKLEAGHSYVLNLHLGLNSVKIDAEVAEWIDVQPQDIDLPLNVPAFTVGSTPTVTVPYTGNYTFAITGLNGGESVDYAEGTPTLGWTGTEANANQSGVAIETINAVTNPSAINRNHVGAWTGKQSNTPTSISFVQKAHPLELEITSAGGTAITLGRSSDFTATDDWYTQGTQLLGESTKRDPEIKLWRNGALLKHVTGTPGKGEFQFTNDGNAATSANIILNDPVKLGDIIRVELTTGDAPTANAQYQVTGVFGFYPSSQTVTYHFSKTYSVEALYGEGNITYEKQSDLSNETISALGGTNSNEYTTIKPSATPVTIKATDAASHSVTLSLTVIKQDAVVDLTNKNLPSNNNTLIVDLQTITSFKGKDDGVNLLSSGSVSYALGKVKKSGVEMSNPPIAINSSKLNKNPKASVTAGEYEIEIIVNGTVGSSYSDYYNDDVKTVTITYTQN